MGVALAVVATLACGAILLLLVWLGGRPLGTDDTWWHLAMGELYAGGDLWPKQDPLLHTTVLRPPIPHEWLFQVGLVSLKQGGDFLALRLFHAWMVAALGLGVFALCVRAGRDVVLAALATLVWATLSWYRLIQLRPELLSFAAILALIVLVFARAGPIGRARSGLVLVLFVAWVNAHSLFAIGVCLLIAAAFGAALEFGLIRLRLESSGATDRAALALRRAGGFTALAVAASVVTWLNPQGFAQHATFFTESSGGLIWKIQDDFLPWRPWLWPQVQGGAFTPLAWALSNALYVVTFAVAGRLAWRFWQTRSEVRLAAFDPVGVGLAAAAFVASLVAVRFHWLSVFPLLYLLRAARSTDMQGVLRGLATAGALALALALPVSGGFVGFADEIAREPEGYRADWLDERYAGSGARFLEEARLEGRLYHPFNLGGFLGYRLAPRVTTFIDGRLDHVPAEVLDDYLTLRRTSQRGPAPMLRARLDRWGIDLVFADTFAPEWYPKRESGAQLRRLPEWIRIHASRSHAIYLRRNPRNVENLRRVVAHYAARGVPFHPARGLDVSAAIAAAPEWARAQPLFLPNEAALAAWIDHRDPALRAHARRQLAAHAFRIGDFPRLLRLSEALLTDEPEDRDAGFWQADALRALGRPEEALELAQRLREANPGDLEIAGLADWLQRSQAGP